MSDFQRETDFKREGAVRELQILRKQEESKSMFAIIMAGIAGLFIMAVVAAYNYTSDTSVAQNPLPPSQASGGSSARIPGPPAETTGSASTEKPVQVTPSKSQQN